jgi:hypothetical protein
MLDCGGIYLGETVISPAGTINEPFLRALTAAMGHVRPLVVNLRARGTSMMISFSVGFFDVCTGGFGRLEPSRTGLQWAKVTMFARPTLAMTVLPQRIFLPQPICVQESCIPVSHWVQTPKNLSAVCMSLFILQHSTSPHKILKVSVGPLQNTRSTSLWGLV